MGKSIETYIKHIITTLKCSEEEKVEIEEELKDHLYLLKNEYLEDGYSETEAIKKAINTFGEENKIRKGLQNSISPLYKFVNYGTWLLFLFYTYVLLSELLIKRIIINQNVGGPSYYLMPYIYDINIFDKDIFLLNTNFIPFRNISNYIINHNSFNLDIVLYNTLGNILIFLPLGIFLPLLFRNVKLFKALTVFIMVSLIIELLQYPLEVGQTDIDDIILRSIGGVVGFLIIKLSIQFFFFCKSVTRKLQYSKWETYYISYYVKKG